MNENSWIGGPDWRAIIEPTWLLHKGLSQGLSRLAETVKGDLLDYGCGGMPYRSLFRQCASYTGADLSSNKNANIWIESDGRLPMHDSSVDAVLSTQVLEHVRDPASYLAECCRVLRPEGRLILSTHGFFMWHGPGDWRRWTHEGLIYEVESAGFRVLELDAICVLRAFFLQFLNYTVFSRLLGHFLTYPLGATLVAMINTIGSLFPTEVLSTSAKEKTHLGFCYLIVAERQTLSPT